MNVRQIRNLLRVAATGMFLAAIAVAAWALAGPAPLPPPGDSASSASPRPRVAEAAASPALQDFARLWKKPLARPLYDPPPQDSQATSQTRDPTSGNGKKRAGKSRQIGLQLIGTVLERGRSMAIFMDSAGKIDVKGEGQTLDLAPEGTLVKKIETEQVTLWHQGEALLLQMPKPKGW